MIFTLYYMYSTILQWWRLGSLRNKINGTLNSHNALMVCVGSSVSDSKNHRCLENLLFQNEDRIGCTVVPKQHIDLNQWATFPRDLNYFPIYISEAKAVLNTPKIFLLVQAKLDDYIKHQGEIIQIENFGELIAWRVADHFEVILKTDMTNLTKFVNCFCDHNIDINHELRLLRIETIDVDGNPSRIKYSHRYPLEHRTKYSVAPVHWTKFVAEVKTLYSKLHEASSNKILEHPTIKIENSSKTEEPSQVPKSESKSIKKSESSKHHNKLPRKESKNKLDVTSLETRRSKSSKSKTEKSKESERKREHKSKEHESKETVEVERKTKAPKLGECNLSSKDSSDKPKQKTRREARLRSRDKESSSKKDEIKISNGHVEVRQCESHEEAKEPTSNGDCSLSKKEDDVNCKPPNVLIFADSIVAKDNVKNVIHSILNNHKYTVYDFPTNASDSQLWMTTTALIVVCGNVPPNLTSQFLQYLINGGKLLCLCSDLLYSVLTIFSTAEVREHELVRFSYGNWKRVKMMHHVFCYQASPAKRQFSKDSDQSNSSSRGSSPVAPRTPSTVEIQHNGKKYTVQVQVLGAEETWHTPSLLLAAIKNSQGIAIFSQVHLEIDPTQYQDDENKYAALTESNQARLEILKHILSQHLSMDCTSILCFKYGPVEARNALECSDIVDNKLSNDKLVLEFCGKGVEPQTATAVYLPVLIHACPANFSTVKYFETLSTNSVGRLVIYVDVLTSSQFILSKTLKHGLVIIVKQQTQGIGRSGNEWLSPSGCAMFSLQLHIPMKSNLGKSLPLLQHLIMVAVVSAIKNIPGYEGIDLGLKWPNDLYANRDTKIGGVAVNSSIFSNLAIVNIGCGINLDNVEPTTCINQLIHNYNEAEHKNLPKIEYEEFFATVFNEIERIYDEVQNGGMDYLFELYYKYWLHSGAEINVTGKSGQTCKASIMGIDEFGYLKVCSEDGTISSVQPDGNSFDMMKGLIAPKLF